MYKIAQRNFQRAIDHVDWASMAREGLRENATDEERHENYRRALKALEPHIIVATGEERKRLGLIKHNLTQEMRAIKPKAKLPDMPHFVIAEARAYLGPVAWKIVLARAEEKFHVALSEGAL